MKKATLITLVLVGLLVEPARAQEPGTTITQSATISAPLHPVVLVVDLPGFKVKNNELQTLGQSPRKYFYASHETSKVDFSIFLEKVPVGTPNNCREHLKELAENGRRNFNAKNIRFRDSNGQAFLEYFTPELLGVKVQQGNLFVCWMNEDVFIDLHFSKALFQPDDGKVFTAILDTVRFEKETPSSREAMALGSSYYLQKNYRRAIEFYEEALKLNKQDQQLEKNFWRAAVDDLGTAYGISGDLKRAKEVFEYGLSLDATYPNFHYSMACAYAEMGDMGNSMKYLENAFEYKENRIPGEDLPDPRKDSSFQRFMKNQEFRKFLDVLMGEA